VSNTFHDVTAISDLSEGYLYQNHWSRRSCGMVK